jgi:hypothetical protein
MLECDEKDCPHQILLGAVATPRTEQRLPWSSPPARFGSVPNVGSHGGPPETYCGGAPTPFSTLRRRSRRMKLPFPAPSLGLPHHRPPRCAHLAPNQQSVSNLGLKVSFLQAAPAISTGPLVGMPTQRRAAARFFGTLAPSGTR